MRGLLMAMMRQAPKVERFKERQDPLERPPRQVRHRHRDPRC
jgi:hypothetical protein